MLTVQTPAYRALPRQLTDAIPAPPPPPRVCKDAHGQPAVCALDGLLQIPAWRAVLQQCNADRATAARYGATDLTGTTH